MARKKLPSLKIRGVILDSQPIIEKLIKFRKNEKVKAIVLRIDSPGGAVGPAQEIYTEIKKVQRGKKVLASVGSTAASGGLLYRLRGRKDRGQPGFYYWIYWRNSRDFEYGRTFAQNWSAPYGN